MFLNAGVFPVTCRLPALSETRHISHFTVSSADMSSVAVGHFSRYIKETMRESLGLLAHLKICFSSVLPSVYICQTLEKATAHSHMMFFYSSKDRPEDPAATP